MDSQEMRRLLAERDTLIARIGQEKAASLANLMQPLNKQTPQASRTLPVEEQLLQAWEDIDKLVEEKASSMRATAQATEQFDEIRGRLMMILDGAYSLLRGVTSNPALYAVISLGGDLATDIESLTQKGVDGAGDISEENTTAHGPAALQRQASTIRAHLESLEKAETDIKKLRGVAQLMADKLGPEKSAELAAVIAQLERDMAITKSALVDRLTVLEIANSHWVDISQHTKLLEDISKRHEDTLKNIRSNIDCFEIDVGNKNCGIASMCAAFLNELMARAADLENLRAAAAAFGIELDSVDSEVLGMLTSKRTDDSGQEIDKIILDVDGEVAFVQNSLQGLQRRRKGLADACGTLTEDLKATIMALQEYTQHLAVVQAHLDVVEALRGDDKAYNALEEALGTMGQINATIDERNATSTVGKAFKRTRELAPHLRRSPQLTVSSCFERLAP